MNPDCSFCYQFKAKYSSQFSSSALKSYKFIKKNNGSYYFQFSARSDTFRTFTSYLLNLLIRFHTDYIVASKGLSERRQFRSSMDWQDGEESLSMWYSEGRFTKYRNEEEFCDLLALQMQLGKSQNWLSHSPFRHKELESAQLFRDRSETSLKVKEGRLMCP